MKEAYYFPHDSNAIHDPKCAALINDHGMTGYGFYWMLIEVMHEQGGKIEKFPKLYDGLSHDFHCEKELAVKLIEALLNDYNLLQQDDKHIWSDRVLRNIGERKMKYDAKVEAGRLGGIKSGLTRSLQSKSKQNEAPLEANEQKERKGKEIKQEQSLESISEIHFKDVWSKYPSKTGVGIALRNFRKTVKNLEDLDLIKNCLKTYLAHLAANDWKKPQNGSTWFNNWRDWIDFKETAQPKPQAWVKP